MKFRYLYINDFGTYEAHWLIHGGSDVYCGVLGNLFKVSYHGSGKRHVYLNNERKVQTPHLPLRDFKGSAHLNTFAFVNTNEEYLTKDGMFRKYCGKKSDATLTLDGRTIPIGVTVNVALGLIEPNNMDALGQLLRDFPEPDAMKIKRLMIVNDVSPWIYSIVLW